MKTDIRLSWYGGDSIHGYVAQFEIDGVRHEYGTESGDRLDDIIRTAKYSPGKTLALAKKCCKYMGKVVR
jgi:hypothetical protein